MPSFSGKFIFRLPYHINMVNGQVIDDLVLPLKDYQGKVTIHPPEASEEKRTTFQSPEKTIWSADRIQIDVEIESAYATPTKDLQPDIETIAKGYAQRFLKHCRARTKQFWIDPRAQIYASLIVYDEGSSEQQRISVIPITLKIGDPPSLNDSSYDAVRQDLVIGAQIPLHEELLLDAKLYRSEHDYRMAFICAAIAIEVVVSSYLRKKLRYKLVNEGRTSISQIDRFVEQVSNRLLIRVALGLFTKVEEKVLLQCHDTLELRNKILHGKMKSVPSSAKVKAAIEGLEGLLSNDDIQETLSGKVS